MAQSPESSPSPAPLIESVDRSFGPGGPTTSSVRLDLEPTSASSVTSGRRGGHIVVVRKTVGDQQTFVDQVRWLTRARNHPVAELCGIDAGSLTYSTRFEGGHTLSTAAIGPGSGQRLLLRLAHVVGSLHASGLTHGNLEPGHVVVDGSRLILISPSGAPSESGQDRGEDIRGFAATMTDLVELWSVLGRADPAVLEQWTVAARTIHGTTVRTAARLPEIVAALPTRRRRISQMFQRPHSRRAAS